MHNKTNIWLSGIPVGKDEIDAAFPVVESIEEIQEKALKSMIIEVNQKANQKERKVYINFKYVAAMAPIKWEDLE